MTKISQNKDKKKDLLHSITESKEKQNRQKRGGKRKEKEKKWPVSE